MNQNGAPPEVLERARKARWANKTPEQRKFHSQYINACRTAKIRGEGLERCIRAQELLAYELQKGFQDDDMSRFFQASMHMMAWEKLRMMREKQDGVAPAIEYQAPQETDLGHLDQKELEKLASGVPAYRPVNNPGTHHARNSRPSQQHELGQVVGVAARDQAAKKRRDDEAAVEATARPLYGEEE